jgi:hypothetical protein
MQSSTVVVAFVGGPLLLAVGDLVVRRRKRRIGLTVQSFSRGGSASSQGTVDSTASGPKSTLAAWRPIKSLARPSHAPPQLPLANLLPSSMPNPRSIPIRRPQGFAAN